MNPVRSTPLSLLLRLQSLPSFFCLAVQQSIEDLPAARDEGRPSNLIDEAGGGEEDSDEQPESEEFENDDTELEDPSKGDVEIDEDEGQ